jgi:hypothetical protein
VIEFFESRPIRIASIEFAVAGGRTAWIRLRIVSEDIGADFTAPFPADHSTVLRVRCGTAAGGSAVRKHLWRHWAIVGIADGGLTLRAGKRAVVALSPWLRTRDRGCDQE